MDPLTILLVEDEPLIALEMKIELEQAGYIVRTACNVESALLLCERYLPDVAILNFLYENRMDGMALACSLRTRFLVRVLFITGANWTDLENSPHFYAGHEVLHKPFTRPQLRAALGAVAEETGKVQG